MTRNDKMLNGVFAAILVASLFVLPFVFLLNVPNANKSVQYAQVEVIGKRVGPSSIDTYTPDYIVEFKFPDDSVKELSTYVKGLTSTEWQELYNSISVGDTGILTYSEIENIEGRFKNERSRWRGRQFISFEKD